MLRTTITLMNDLRYNPTDLSGKSPFEGDGELYSIRAGGMLRFNHPVTLYG